MNRNPESLPEGSRGVKLPSKMSAVPVQVRSLSKEKAGNTGNSVSVKVVRPQIVPGPEQKSKSKNVMNVNVPQIKGPEALPTQVVDNTAKGVRFSSEQNNTAIDKPVISSYQAISPRPNPNGHHPGRTISQPQVENFAPIGEMRSSIESGSQLPSGRFSFDPNAKFSFEPLQRTSENDYLRKSNIVSSINSVPGDLSIRKSANIDRSNNRQGYNVESTLNRTSSTSRMAPPINQASSPGNSPSVVVRNQFSQSPLRTSFNFEGHNVGYENFENQELMNLKLALVDKDMQLDHLKKRCSHLEHLLSRGNEGTLMQLKEADERTILILNENEKLNKILHENLTELASSRKKIKRLEKALLENKSGERFIEIEAKLRQAMNENEQWKQKYFELESDRASIEKVKKNAQQEREQVEKDASKYKEILDQRNKEIQELRSIFTVLEGKTRDSTRVKELEGLIVMLGIEIERLHNLFREKLEESEALKHKHTKLEVVNAELRGKEARLSEYENRCLSLSQEIEKLSKEKRGKTEEAESWRTKAVHLEINMQDKLALENDLRLYRDALENRNSEIEEWRTRVNKLELNLAEQRTNEGFIQERQREAEIKLNIMNTEAERLRTQIKQKDDHIDELKSKMIKFDFFNSQIQLYDQETSRLREIINERSNEGEQARRKVAELESKVAEQRRSLARLSETENKCAMLTQEIDRLLVSNNNWMEEVASLKSKLAAESSFNKAEHSSKEKLMEEYSEKLEKLTKDTNAAAGKISLLSQEITRLNGIIKQRDDEVESLRMKLNKMEMGASSLENQEQKIKLLSLEIDRLASLNEEYSEESRKMREKLQDYTLKSLKLEELMVNFVLISAELESLRDLNSDKIKEVDELRRASLRASIGLK